MLYFLFAFYHKFVIFTRSTRTRKPYSVKSKSFEWKTDHTFKINNEFEDLFPINAGDFSVKIIWNRIQVNYNFSSFRITAKPTHTLQLFRLILSKKWNSPKFHLPLSILRKSLTMYGLFEIDRTAVLNWITRLSFNCSMDSAN